MAMNIKRAVGGAVVAAAWMTAGSYRAGAQTPSNPPIVPTAPAGRTAAPGSPGGPISWGGAASPGASPGPPAWSAAQGTLQSHAAPTATAASAAGSGAAHTVLAVSVAAAARLRSAGLDPADPHFREMLAARLANANANATMLARASALPVNPDPSRDPRAPRGVLPQAVRIAIAGGNAVGNARNPIRPAVTAIGQSNGATPWEIHQMYKVVSSAGSWAFAESQVSITLEPLRSGTVNGKLFNNLLMVPGTYVATFNAPQGSLPQTAQSIASAHISVPDCHVEVDTPVAIGPAAQFLPATANSTGSGAGKYNGAAQFGIPTSGAGESILPSANALPLGASGHEGVITLQWGNSQANIQEAFFSDYLTEGDSLAISTDPPFFSSPNVLGFGAKQFVFAAPTVSRFNPSSEPIVGDDTLGIGVQLSPGYEGTTAVVSSVSSVADSAGENAVDDVHRGATVTVQPSNGRAQVTVHWHIGPGDSLQYQLDWQFLGPSGQRPIPTMPLRGPCDA
jgi:hypothetical protein